MFPSLLEGVRTQLFRFAEDVAATEVVGRLFEATTNGLTDCADLTSDFPQLPKELPPSLNVLKSGSTEEQLGVLARFRIWANESPADFEPRQQYAGSNGKAGESSQWNVLVLIFAAYARCTETDIRLLSIQALGELGFRAASVMEVLAKRINNLTVSKFERRECARALARTGHVEAAWPLIQSLINPAEDLYVRREAAAGIGVLGPCASFALPSLLVSLGNEDLELQTQSKQALKRIDPGLTQTVKILCRALERRWFVFVVRGCLASYRWLRGIPAPSQFSAHLAAQLLGRLGPDAASAVPQLLRAVGSGREDVRAGAIEALGRISPGERSVCSAAKGLLNDSKPDVRLAACGCLRAIAQQGLTPKDVQDVNKLLQERMRIETESAVQREISVTAERLWTVTTAPSLGNPEAPTLDQTIKNHVLRNLISMILRGFCVLIRKVVVGV